MKKLQNKSLEEKMERICKVLWWDFPVDTLKSEAI